MQQYDVSAILLFQDDEERIGTAVAQMADHLRQRGGRFELLAINVDSKDNSPALLALIRAEYPELRVLTAPNPRRAYEFATEKALGQLAWFTTPRTVVQSLDTITKSLDRVTRESRDLVVAGEFALVADRKRLIQAVRGLHSVGRCVPKQLEREARSLGLNVESSRGTPRSNQRTRWFQPLFTALSFNRAL